MALPNVPDLKAQLNITGSGDDDELAMMLEAATDLVAGIVGPIAPVPVVEVHRGVYSRLLVLRQMPVVELVGISAGMGLGATALEAVDFVLDTETGILRAGNGAAFYGDYTVTYTAGRDELPAAVHLATLIVASHLWDTQRGNTGGGPLAADTDDTFGVTPGAGFAIPNRAKELLAPYARSPQIA